MNLEETLRQVGRLKPRRGMVVIASDFLDDSDWGRPLRVLADKHTVLAVEVVDPRELEIPPVGILAVVDPETGARRHVDTNSARLRERFRQAADAQRVAIADTLARAGVDHFSMRTDEDWVPALVRHMEINRQRVKAGAMRR